MESIIVVVIVAAAAAYTARALYRKASLRARKSCGCEGGCPISEMCNPADGRCVVGERETKVAPLEGTEGARPVSGAGGAPDRRFGATNRS